MQTGVKADEEKAARQKAIFSCVDHKKNTGVRPYRLVVKVKETVALLQPRQHQMLRSEGAKGKDIKRQAVGKTAKNRIGWIVASAECS